MVRERVCVSSLSIVSLPGQFRLPLFFVLLVARSATISSSLPFAWNFGHQSMWASPQIDEEIRWLLKLRVDDSGNHIDHFKGPAEHQLKRMRRPICSASLSHL